MRGICLDALNPYGRPHPQRVLYGTGHRLVAVDNVEFYWYVHQLRRYNYQVAVVLTADSYSPKLDYYSESHRWALVLGPDTVYILGNEWNVDNDASWPTDNYADFYDKAWSGIKTAQPLAEVYVGGMFSSPTLMSKLNVLRQQVQVQGVDLHLYQEDLPATQDILHTLHDDNLQLCIGEWNWQGGSQADFIQYQRILNAYTEHSFYFCWSDGMVPSLGLTVIANTNRKPEYKYYKEALRVRTQ